MGLPNHDFLDFSVWTQKMIEVKGGCLVKKWEFCNMEKIQLYQLFQSKKSGLMTKYHDAYQMQQSIKHLIP